MAYRRPTSSIVKGQGTWFDSLNTILRDIPRYSVDQAYVAAVSANCLAATESRSDAARQGGPTENKPSLLRKASMLVDHEMIEAIWEQGQVVLGQDSQGWRKDQCGAWIGRDFYGNRESEFGWEIDQIDPKGSDAFANFRPLQWRNDMEKSDGQLKCHITAVDMHNADSRHRS